MAFTKKAAFYYYKGFGKWQDLANPTKQILPLSKFLVVAQHTGSRLVQLAQRQPSEWLGITRALVVEFILEKKKSVVQF